MNDSALFHLSATGNKKQIKNRSIYFQTLKEWQEKKLQLKTPNHKEKKPTTKVLLNEVKVSQREVKGNKSLAASAADEYLAAKFNFIF